MPDDNPLFGRPTDLRNGSFVVDVTPNDDI